MYHFTKHTLFSIVLIFLAPSFAQAQITLGTMVVDTHTVAKNLHVPWEIAWGPDNKIWFTERNGNISHLDLSNGNIKRLVTIPDAHEQSEGGLLGMAFHPSFTLTPHVFVVYNYLAGALIQEKLVRYSYFNDSLINPVILLDSIAGNNNHNGSRIITTPDHKLIMSTGDAQAPSTAQQNESISGKFLRMNLDSSIPTDNPFPGSLIWSKGHRNPQGIVLANNGHLYSSEHGPDNDDEVNIISKGMNYGWPTVQGYCNTPAEITFCNDSAVQEPIKAWTPTLAVAGIDYYGNTALSDWNNSLLMVTLKESDFRVLKLNPNGDAIISESVFFNNAFGRLRDVCISPQGKVYIATSNRDDRGTPIASDDRIIEISAHTTSVNPIVQEAQTVNIHPNPFSEFTTLEVEHAEAYKLTVLDMAGRIMDANIVRHNDSFIISREGLKDGIYLYQLKTDKGKTITGKLFIEE